MGIPFLSGLGQALQSAGGNVFRYDEMKRSAEREAMQRALQMQQLETMEQTRNIQGKQFRNQQVKDFLELLPQQQGVSADVAAMGKGTPFEGQFRPNQVQSQSLTLPGLSMLPPGQTGGMQGGASAGPQQPSPSGPLQRGPMQTGPQGEGDQAFIASPLIPPQVRAYIMALQNKNEQFQWQQSTRDANQASLADARSGKLDAQLKALENTRQHYMDMMTLGGANFDLKAKIAEIDKQLRATQISQAAYRKAYQQAFQETTKDLNLIGAPSDQVQAAIDARAETIMASDPGYGTEAGSIPNTLGQYGKDWGSIRPGTKPGTPGAAPPKTKFTLIPNK